MERFAINELIKWNEGKARKPLIVWGARQVGKTYLIKEIFAKRYYKDKYIYIDCKVEDEIREFCSNTASAEKLLSIFPCARAEALTKIPCSFLMRCRNVLILCLL